ncbi:MAG: lytic transglycosylase domain-containing protein [Thermodesulfovibrionales bacterium]
MFVCIAVTPATGYGGVTPVNGDLPAVNIDNTNLSAPSGREIQTILADCQDLLTRRIRKRFNVWLDNSSRYLPMIRQVFDKKGLPPDLVYLPLIESGFSPYSVSPAGAVGLWQFIPETGKRYGLKIDDYVDERRDPFKSTVAAAGYLSDLYDMFGSWSLVLAAYNAGEGRIQRIAYRVGDDIWKHRRTPEETRRYVPLFLAALRIARDPESYGFDVKDSPVIETEEVLIKKMTPLSKLAKKYKTKISVLRALNPALLTDSTPLYLYKIRVPSVE